MLIKDVMMKNPLVFKESDDMIDIVKMMKHYSADSFPVVNAKGLPVGVIMTTVSGVGDHALKGRLASDMMRPVDDLSIVKEFEEISTIFNRGKELFFVVDDMGKFKSILRKRHVMIMYFEKLAYQRDHLDALMTSLEVGVLFADRTGRIVRVNPKAIELMAEKEKTLINEKFQTFFRTERKLPSSDISSETFGETFVCNNKRLLISKVPVLRHGKNIGLVILVRDTTEYRKIEEQLTSEKSENEILKTVFDIAYDGLIVVDSEGYVKMISNAYKKFLKLEKVNLVGKHVTEVIENTRLHLVAKTGIPEIGDLQKIQDSYIIASRIPVFENGRVTNVVGKVMFRNIGELDELYNKIGKIEQQLENYKNELNQVNKATYHFSDIVGKSREIRQVVNLAKKSAYTNSNVLILGESGTGKELFAHSIHNSSGRRNKPFIKVNCAAIPEELLESELFGYEEGAFTGAKKGGKMGKFEVADQGTIFLDEIGDMALSMQAKLLRVIQEREIERIGSNRTKRVDVRIIAATNRHIQQMIEDKKFRLDLFYRLNVVTLEIPPLKDRVEDVEDLCRHFIDKFRTRYLKKVDGISEKSVIKLKKYNWPGNIRELENIIERAINIIDSDSVIRPKHLPVDISGRYDVDDFKTLKEMVEQTERKAILDCLEAVNFNKSRAAKVLGISRTAFYEKLEKYNLKV